MEHTMFNPEMESISAPELKKMEHALLLDQIDYVYANSRFYQDKFKAAEIEKARIKNVQDLSLLPFTTKQELRESQK
ncbi:MAG: hypothetical protein K9K40_09680, partial [Desulfotignum sp.]|nr:hypothetical protein [Desulfotignum sp.]